MRSHLHKCPLFGIVLQLFRCVHSAALFVLSLPRACHAARFSCFSHTRPHASSGLTGAFAPTCPQDAPVAIPVALHYLVSLTVVRQQRHDQHGQQQTYSQLQRQSNTSKIVRFQGQRKFHHSCIEIYKSNTRGCSTAVIVAARMAKIEIFRGKIMNQKFWKELSGLLNSKYIRRYNENIDHSREKNHESKFSNNE